MLPSMMIFMSNKLQRTGEFAKLQRTGKTEGCLIFNHYLKKKYSISFVESEKLFINWLYTTSGWYDCEIDGSNMDIDTEAVKASPVYNRWLKDYTNSLKDTLHTQIMYHEWYFPKVDVDEFRREFPRNQMDGYWQSKPALEPYLKGKILIINPFAEVIAQDYPEYNIIPFRWPYTFLNSGPDKNSFETLDRLYPEIPKEFDTALVAAGSYGCLLVDKLSKFGNALTLGSGLHHLFPVKKIPAKLRPKYFKEIEDGSYWEGLEIC
jgi:hypothetical protein